MSPPPPPPPPSNRQSEVCEATGKNEEKQCEIMENAQNRLKIKEKA